MINLHSIASRFVPGESIKEIREHGKGNINSTFLVTTDSSNLKHFILQSINTRVFHQPELVIRNMRITTQHILERLKNSVGGKFSGWKVPELIPTLTGDDYWRAPDGSFWRAISFIESASSFDTIIDHNHAVHVGNALGIFHVLLADLPSENLSDPLKGFHITPSYLGQYDRVCTRSHSMKSAEEIFCSKFISRRRDIVHILEDAKSGGRLKIRPVHGDPKVNNIMIDDQTKKAVSIIDLDTVKPGIIHYDIGDCIRSGCNTLGENLSKWESVKFDAEICRSILNGYIEMSRNYLSNDDFDLLYDAIRLLSFELGLRFFTDHLEGNVYFNVKYPDHNLARALVQFKLTESIESQSSLIQKIIKEAQRQAT